MTFAYFWAGLKPPTRWGRSHDGQKGWSTDQQHDQFTIKFNLQNSASCPQQKVQNPSYKVGFTGGLWLGFWWIKNPFGLIFPCVFTFNQVEHTIPGRVAPSFKTLVPRCHGATKRRGLAKAFTWSWRNRRRRARCLRTSLWGSVSRRCTTSPRLEVVCRRFSSVKNQKTI
jgi:hypothetical protein